jgi:hypothetical protein
MKKLIINPSKQESKNLTIINVPAVVAKLIQKVLRIEEDNKFEKMVTNDHHTKVFVNNVAYKRVPIQDYSGKELNSMQEAVDYYIEIGNKIYGKNWMVELIKNEVRLSKENDFGVKTQDPELVQYIHDRLKETDSNVQVIIGSNASNETSNEVKEAKKSKKEMKNV